MTNAELGKAFEAQWYNLEMNKKLNRIFYWHP